MGFEMKKKETKEKKESFPVTWTANLKHRTINRLFYEAFPYERPLHHATVAKWVDELWLEAYKYGRADEHRLHVKNRRKEFMKVINAIITEVKDD